MLLVLPVSRTIAGVYGLCKFAFVQTSLPQVRADREVITAAVSKVRM